MVAGEFYCSFLSNNLPVICERVVYHDCVFNYSTSLLYSGGSERFASWTTVGGITTKMAETNNIHVPVVLKSFQSQMITPNNNVDIIM